MSTSVSFPVNPQRTAILSMDIQTALVSIYVKESEGFLSRVRSVLSEGRKQDMLICHIRVGFRPGLPEISSRNPLLAQIKASAQHQQIFQGPLGEIHSAVQPESDEIVITKHRVSAFTGTDLSMILRAHDVEALVMFGISTSGVVLSTALEAGDQDYRVVVVRDCCVDLDLELHACLLDKLLPRGAQVMSAAEFEDWCGRGRS